MRGYGCANGRAPDLLRAVPSSRLYGMRDATMSRRTQLGYGAVALATIVAVAGLAAARGARPSHAGAAETRPPNVVMILVDDANFREVPYLPKVQSLLAAHGTTFPNYFDSVSECCPARAGIMSGQYNHNNHVYRNADTGKFDNSNSLPLWLHRAGYTTALIGKYLNGYSCTKAHPPGWDDWQLACPANQQYSYVINDNGTQTQYGKTPADYQVNVLRNRMVDTLNQDAAADSPFFVYVAPTVPHTPLQLPPGYATAAVPTIPDSPSFNEADVSDKPPWIQARPIFPKARIAAIHRSEVARMRMLLSIDDLVQSAVDTLTATGQIDNTVIIFTNDNGYMRGEHRLGGGKGDVYLESMNSGPLIIRGPGFPEGTTNPSLIGNVDIAPTISAIAGATPGRVEDGLNFLPAVSDPTLFNDRVFLHHRAKEQNRIDPIPTADGVRVGNRYVYYRYRDAAGTEELYDYRVDPYELDNKASDPAYASLKADLFALVRQLMPGGLTVNGCTGTGCQLTYSG
jgi:arylsulfatase A-like enzyme